MGYASVVLTADWGSESPRTAQVIGCVKQADPALEVCPAHIWLGRGNVGQSSDLLYSMLPFWPAGTVFLNLVHRAEGETVWLAAVMKNGCVVLTPDNGSITMPLKVLGAAGLYRVPGENDDFQAARLAGRLAREGLSASLLGRPVTAEEVALLPWSDPVLAPGRAAGVISQVMQNFGNLYTNIPIAGFQTTGIQAGDWVQLTIRKGEQVIFDQKSLYHHSFGFAEDGAPIVFNGSSGFMGFGLNRRNFVKTYLSQLEQPGQRPTEYQVSIVKADRSVQDEK
ncbi:MAG: SAM-dependent chlorinase/fluorinase [Candidatus Onthomonas sp.]